MDEDTVQAGEYALGVLPWEERMAFEARLRRDAALQAQVDFWQGQLSPILLTVPPMAAPDVLDRVQRSLFGAPPVTQTLWGRMAGLTRRQLVIAALVILAVGAAVAAKIMALLHFLR